MAMKRGREQTAGDDRVHHDRQQRNPDDREPTTEGSFQEADQERNTPAKATRIVIIVRFMLPPPPPMRSGVGLNVGPSRPRLSREFCVLRPRAGTVDRRFDLRPHEADVP